jgi:hypothetical protein
MTTSLVVLVGGPTLANNEVSGVKGEIEDLFREDNKALQESLKTLDSTGALKYYACDFSGEKEDGTKITRKDLEKIMDEAVEQFKLLDSISRSMKIKITDLNIQLVTERVARVTYQSEKRLDEGEMSGYCQVK